MRESISVAEIVERYKVSDMNDKQIAYSRINDEDLYRCENCDAEIESDGLCSHTNHTLCETCCSEHESEPRYDRNDLD